MRPSVQYRKENGSLKYILPYMAISHEVKGTQVLLVENSDLIWIYETETTHVFISW